MRLVRNAEALRESESSNKDATRQLQELTLIRSELQSERDALHSELSEASDANRDLRSNLDAANAALQQVKQDMDNRLRDAAEEIESVRYVYSLFSGCISCVKWDSIYSVSFCIDFGVRQGSVLSPVLFALLIE